MEPLRAKLLREKVGDLASKSKSLDGAVGLWLTGLTGALLMREGVGDGYFFMPSNCVIKRGVQTPRIGCELTPEEFIGFLASLTKDPQVGGEANPLHSSPTVAEAMKLLIQPHDTEPMPMIAEV
jgi:hypothetical protein